MINKNKEDILSRVRNATRDTAVSFVAFRNADRRLYDALREARSAGASEQELDRAIMSAAKGNPKVKAAVEEYARELQEANKRGTANPTNPEA